MVQDIVAPERMAAPITGGLPKNANQIEKLTARAIMATARAGDLRNLSNDELRAICKGLGLSYSGFNKVHEITDLSQVFFF